MLRKPPPSNRKFTEYRCSKQDEYPNDQINWKSKYRIIFEAGVVAVGLLFQRSEFADAYRRRPRGNIFVPDHKVNPTWPSISLRWNFPPVRTGPERCIHVVPSRNQIRPHHQPAHEDEHDQRAQVYLKHVLFLRNFHDRSIHL